jgi:uncharacterized protein (DUF1501 family)
LGTISHPNIGAWTNHILGGINPALPANVSIGSGGGGGYLGARATPFNVVDINDPFGSLMPENAFSNAYREQLNLVIALGQNFRKKIRNADVQSVSDSYNQAIKLMSSDDIHAFDTSLEDKETQASYGKMGQKLLLGRRLIESGVRHVGIDFGGWDDHDDLWGNFPSRAMSLDRVLSVFLQDMEKRGLLKNTTIAFKTEFGRTPVHKDKKGLGSGRDHYPKAFSTWMAGAGVKKGFVYGATDARGEFPLENIVTPMDYNATLAKIMGISLGKEIYSPDNRPFTIARDGQPIMDILA